MNWKRFRPTFPSPFQNVSLSESSRIGHQLVLSPASDNDSGANGRIVNYTISSGNEENKFNLNFFGEDNALLLELIAPLDREEKSLYILNISAEDGGIPKQTGFVTIFVHVIDSNDNSPIFNESDYHVTIGENIEPGISIQIILKLK